MPSLRCLLTTHDFLALVTSWHHCDLVALSERRIEIRDVKSDDLDHAFTVVLYTYSQRHNGSESSVPTNVMGVSER